MSTLTAALGVCLSLAGASPQGGGTPELRGGWLMADTFATAAQRAATVAKFKRAHLNTAFPTAPPLNGNYGESDPAAFAAFLDDATAAGLSVHVWVQNYKRRGDANPADFRDPAEREAQKQWALDLLQAYPKLDGVHFDYIRYSTWEDSDASKINAITDTLRLTREALRARHPGKPLTAAVFRAAAVSYRGQNGTWKGDVPPWYRDWYAADPDNWYAVQARTDPALNPSWLLGPSFQSYQQDPPSWLKAGVLEGIMSMQYTAVDKTWQDEVLIWKSFLAHLRTSADGFYMGLGWMGPSPWWGDSAFDAPAMVRFIKYGRSQGLKGFVIFRLGQPGVDDTPLLDALSVDGPANGNDAPFETDVPSPLGGAAAPAPAPSPPPPSGSDPGGGSEGSEGCGATGAEAALLLAWRKGQRPKSKAHRGGDASPRPSP
jgi:hypothetical protein